jgi:hypothetical protein
MSETSSFQNLSSQLSTVDDNIRRLTSRFASLTEALSAALTANSAQREASSGDSSSQARSSSARADTVRSQLDTDLQNLVADTESAFAEKNRFIADFRTVEPEVGLCRRLEGVVRRVPSILSPDAFREDLSLRYLSRTTQSQIRMFAYDLIRVGESFEQLSTERKQELRSCMYDVEECDFDYKRRAFDDWVRVVQKKLGELGVDSSSAARAPLSVPSLNTTV